MWNTDNKYAFLSCVAPLEQQALIQELKQFTHHCPTVTRYEHSLLVAYFSFLFCRKYHLDYTAAARGGILHDLYFANWQGSECGALIRWRTHPREALRNASAAYNITAREADIIVKHMWPLTAARPRYAEAYVVSMADKLAAVLEKTRLTRLLGIQTELLSLAALSACV